MSGDGRALAGWRLAFVESQPFFTSFSKPSLQGLPRGGGAPAAMTSGNQHQEASIFQVSTTLSGLSEMEAMPASHNQRAKSGWSLGP